MSLITLRSTSSTLSPDHEHEHDLEASSDHDTLHMTHSHSHTHSQAHPRAHANTGTHDHVPATPLTPSPAHIQVRSVRRPSRWWYAILCLAGMVLIIMWRMIGPTGWLASYGYGHVGWNVQPTLTLQTDIHTKCWGKQTHVPPFPTHTRNVTRQLEWIDHYDTSPFHGCHTGIIITFVNMGFIDMTLNWLCHIRALKISSYLIIAMDQKSYHAMLKWDPTIHVYLWKPDINLMDPTTITDPDPSIVTSTDTSTDTSSIDSATLEYNHPTFVNMMVRRLRFTIDMLRLWPDPLIFVDTDIILLHDILPEFTSGVDSIRGDVIGQADDTSGVVCAGQILFRPRPNVIQLLEDVLVSTINKEFLNEQDALNHGFLFNKKSQYYPGGERAINTVLLSPAHFPSGADIWGRLGDLHSVPNTLKRIAEQGWMPASVHNNWILKKDVKIKRFQDYGMWQADDIDKGTCLFDSYYNIHMPPKPRLNIHILAYKRVDSLERLLKSLSAAHYDDREIDVSLHVDTPADTSDVITLGLVRAVVKLFRDEWEWKHGKKIVHQRDQHVGQNRQYYDLWQPPTTNDEVIIVLQDDEIMSPYWYTWLRKAIDTYYGTDPFMYGISLQRQYFVPGAYGTGPNPPVSQSYAQNPQKGGVRWKRDNKPLLYQQLGTWGQVFFPAHYRLFQEYVRIHRSHAKKHGNIMDMDPSIGNLETNSWFRTEKQKTMDKTGTLQFDDINWEYWFMAMTCEYGLYTMYTDFANEKALLINNQEAGDHYDQTAGPDAKIMNDESWNPTEHMQFPDVSDQPVYDFWMKPVQVRTQLALRRMLLHKYWKQHQYNIVPQLPRFTS